MIDEIDTGIHYSRMKDFWKTILQAATENKVQLFATTHSKECLQYYKEAIAELKLENESRVIAMVETKNKDIKAITYKFDEFEHSLNHDNELR
jgi:AAA15 family ATPase/GTPase